VACIQACTTAWLEEVEGASSWSRARGHSLWISTSIASHHMPARDKTCKVARSGLQYSLTLFWTHRYWQRCLAWHRPTSRWRLTTLVAKLPCSSVLKLLESKFQLQVRHAGVMLSAKSTASKLATRR